MTISYHEHELLYEMDEEVDTYEVEYAIQFCFSKDTPNEWHVWKIIKPICSAREELAKKSNSDSVKWRMVKLETTVKTKMTKICELK